MRWLCILVPALIFLSSCESNSKNREEIGEIIEAPEVVKEVTIGKQVWMTVNLDTDTFRNGDTIPEARTKEEWKQANDESTPAWCYYNNNAIDGIRYGKLYNWHAVNDPRGLAPEGWHVPSDEELIQLIDQLGGEEKAAEKLKSTSDWLAGTKQGSNGNNESGFNGFPGGKRDIFGTFGYIEMSGYWWSSTEAKTDNSWALCIDFAHYINRDIAPKGLGFSVRCLKN